MGKVLDVYWHFSEPGDQYLKRTIDGVISHATGIPPHVQLAVWSKLNFVYELLSSKGNCG